MAKKSVLKTVVGVAAAAVAGKVVYDKYKNTKEKFAKEEEESICEDVKKYNAIGTNKAIEVEDEVFNGCEVKAVASKMLVDLSYATIEKDAYINFSSSASSVLIVLPDGVNAVCDIEKVASNVNNEVENSEENPYTVFIIGKANLSTVEVLPFSAFLEDKIEEDDCEDCDFVDEDIVAEAAVEEE